MSQETVIVELKRIADEHDGVLMPTDVVEAARPKDSPLHSKFEWNNSEAAERYRLWQARQLISVTVEYIGTEEKGKTTRVFVSLTPDRKDGGYRTIESVMMAKDSRAQLFADALEEMERFQKKYKDVQELGEVFAAMRKVRKHNEVAA